MTSMNIEADIREMLAMVTEKDVAHIHADYDLADEIALDSLGRLELLAEIEDKYDVALTDIEVQDAATINDIVRIAKRHLQKEASQ